MPSLEDINSWTIEQIRSEISRLIANDTGLSFLEEHGARWHGASISRADPATGEKRVLYEDVGPDLKITLLNAFGWLWLRTQKPISPAWRPRSDTERSKPPAFFPTTPDVPDLDPNELRAVYENPRKR